MRVSTNFSVSLVIFIHVQVPMVTRKIAGTRQTPFVVYSWAARQNIGMVIIVAFRSLQFLTFFPCAVSPPVLLTSNSRFSEPSRPSQFPHRARLTAYERVYANFTFVLPSLPPSLVPCPDG